MAFEQTQVHADCVDLGVTRDVEHTVQQSTALGAGDRHVEVAVFTDRVFRQQGIAMVAVGVNGIAPVGEIAPHAVGEKFVLRGLWPFVVAVRMPFVFTHHFLQKHQIGRGAAHRFAQLRQDESPVKRGEAFVGVDRQHPKTMNDRRVDNMTLGFAGHVHSSGLRAAYSCD
ncbi:hypothetical protein D3C87_982140 [compost metagenome]